LISMFLLLLYGNNKTILEMLLQLSKVTRRITQNINESPKVSGSVH
jgi:hypothetical protein